MPSSLLFENRISSEACFWGGKGEPAGASQPLGQISLRCAQRMNGQRSGAAAASDGNVNGTRDFGFSILYFEPPLEPRNFGHGSSRRRPNLTIILFIRTDTY